MKRLQSVFLVARRNLWRNHRRTLIMLTAIVIGVWAMMFMTAAMRGMVDQMIKGSIRTLLGHVQIHNPEYLNDPTIASSMPPPEGALLNALESERVHGWSTRIRVPAVVSSERDTTGTTFVGIDPVAEETMLFVKDSIVDGRYLTGIGDDGLIVGRRLLERLETDLGKRVVIMSQDPENEIADRGYRIVGVYETDLKATEEAFVFTGRTVAQKMLRVGDQVSELVVMGDDYRETEGLAAYLQDSAGDGLEAKSWTQIDAYNGLMMKFMDGFILVWVAIIFLALSFGLVNTLAMAVFERVREIGLIQALGWKPGMIVLEVMLESVMLLILGLLIGDLLAWITITPLKDGVDLSEVAEGLAKMGVGAVLYPSLQWRDVFLANGAVIVLGILASLGPAWRASRYNPVTALTKT